MDQKTFDEKMASGEIKQASAEQSEPVAIPNIPIDENNRTPGGLFLPENADIISKLRQIRRPLSAIPTFQPKGFIDQIQFYNGGVYVFLNNVWVQIY